MSTDRQKRNGHYHKSISRRDFLKLLIGVTVLLVFSLFSKMRFIYGAKMGNPVVPKDPGEPSGKVPVIESVDSSRLELGGRTVSVLGSGFKKGDIVLLDGQAAKTSVQDGNSLFFYPPEQLSPGNHVIQVKQADGVLSNQEIFTYSAPIFLDYVLKENKYTLPIVIKVIGRGFVRGMSLFANQQKIEDVVFIDEKTLQLTLTGQERVNVHPDFGGKTIKIRAYTPDGIPARTVVNVMVDTFAMGVLGDSVAWGQGLVAPEKYSFIVADSIQKKHGNRTIYKEVRAHSGAVTGYTVPIDEMGMRFGEIPSSAPSAKAQISEFKGPPEAIDLVLLSVGANDIGLFHIAFAGLHQIVSNLKIPSAQDVLSGAWYEEYHSKLVEGIRIACHDSVKKVLEQMNNKFINPETKIVITGYYQALSTFSDTSSTLSIVKLIYDIARLLMGDASPVGFALGIVSGAVTTNLTMNYLIDNCKTFKEEANRNLAAAVKEINKESSAKYPSPRFIFVDPSFREENALLAPNSYLWGVGFEPFRAIPGGSVLGAFPIDSAANQRIEQCNIQKDRAPLHCAIASLAHPNVEGAKRYANMILQSLGYDPRGSTVPTPDVCRPITREIESLQARLVRLQKELSQASAGEKPDLLLEIRELNGLIANKKAELKRCIAQNVPL